MICPKCNAEYRDGFYTCADCNVRLVAYEESDVDSQATDNSVDPSELTLVPIIDTHDSIFLDEAVCVLEERGIPYVVHSGTAVDLTASDFRNLSWRAILSVPMSAVEEARNVIQQVKARIIQAIREAPQQEGD